MGSDYIGPAVDHFQQITAQFPQVTVYQDFVLLVRYSGIVWCCWTLNLTKDGLKTFVHEPFHEPNVPVHVPKYVHS